MEQKTRDALRDGACLRKREVGSDYVTDFPYRCPWRLRKGSGNKWKKERGRADL